MKLNAQQLSRLAGTAAAAAVRAGKYVSETRPVNVGRKASGLNLQAQVVTEVDHASQAMILDDLAASIREYDLALLTEETEDDRSRLEKDYFWCIDPIDGTLPFIEGIPGFSVSIALVTRAGEPVIGVVYDPVKHTLYSAVQGQGVFRDSKPWHPAVDTAGPLQIFTDRSTAALAWHQTAVEKLGAKVHSTGGGVMNALWGLENPPACYFKRPKPENGGGSFWDFTATACIYAEAGAWVSDAAGGPLRFSRPDSTFMNHCGILFAANRETAEKILNLNL